MSTMQARTKTIAITVGALAAGAVLATGATGVATAAGNPSGQQAATAQAAVDASRGGHAGMGRGPGGHALHGEITVKRPDGTIATIASVNGTVTAVSSTSITVKAEDGYTATYAVTSDTAVRVGVPARPADGTRPTKPPASTDTIADVKVGNVAHVHGTVSGSSMTAIAVRAMTAEQAAQLEAEHAQHQAGRGPSGQ